ncbi:MAG: hypothetical protein EA398_12875 [Deltaproteobacteria bacterium]|nr:MAG: hypothetical protein EA398_12875 [Deltaproteobacteria bacterium]
MTDIARLHGERIWLVTDGTSERAGWQDEFVSLLRERGAAAVDVLGVPAALGWTARSFLERGADQVARAFRFLGGARPEPGDPGSGTTPGPDLVLLDSPDVARPLELLREVGEARVPVVGIVTTFASPQRWREARVHALIVPHPGFIPALGERFTEGMLEVAGPPVAASLLRKLDRTTLRSGLGFATDERVIVMDASTWTPATIEAVMVQLRGAPSPLRCLFFHGGRPESADALRDAAAIHGVRAGMFGDLGDVEEVLTAADLIVVGEGGGLVTPSVVLGRPMLAIDGRAEIPPLTSSGAMWSISGPMELSRVFAEVAWDGVPGTLTSAASSMARRGGCPEVVSAVVRLASRRSQLLHAPTRPAQPNGPGAQPGAEPENARSAGRFEEIGEPTARSRAPVAAGDARDQLARLIMEEKQLENRLADEIRERDRWMRRHELAAGEDDHELARVAEQRVQGHAAVVRQIGQQLEAIEARKDSVRKRVAGVRRGEQPPGPASSTSADSAVEDRFRSMEVERDLDRLRRRMTGGDDGSSTESGRSEPPSSGEERPGGGEETS